MDLTYPAGREVFFIAVERVETKFSDAFRFLAPTGGQTLDALLEEICGDSSDSFIAFMQ